MHALPIQIRRAADNSFLPYWRLKTGRTFWNRQWLGVLSHSSRAGEVTDDSAARMLRVHLLGYNSPPQTTPLNNRPYVLPELIEDAPMYRVAITVADRVKRAEALNKATEIRRKGNRIDAIVNDIHEVIAIRY